MLKTMFFQFINLPDSVPVKFVPRKQLIVKCGDMIMFVAFTSTSEWWVDNVADLLDLVQRDIITIAKLSFC
jgi:hypothetical protein